MQAEGRRFITRVQEVALAEAPWMGGDGGEAVAVPVTDQGLRESLARSPRGRSGGVPID